MAARSRDLQGPARLLLAPNLGQVHLSCRGGRSRRVSRRRCGPPRAAEELDGCAQRRSSDHADPLDQRGLRGVGLRYDHAFLARPGGRHGYCQDPGRGHEGALERQLGRHHVADQAIGGDLSRGRQHAHGDGKVEPRSVLPQIHRREVDHHPAQRPFQARALDRRADPLAGIVHGRSREAGQAQRRETAPDVGLHHDQAPPDPHHGDAVDLAVHARGP